ncbi:MAG TPA: TonB-dependent receptor plug domain-containing protein, partial [Gemmatimonadales bacterium]|nr:TonB-dependent receptor plug domain-containing protein [Gemmatimonadales bacterium]
MLHDSVPVRGVRVQTGPIRVATGPDGTVTLRLGSGTHTVVLSRIGLAPETVTVALQSPRDTTLVVRLDAEALKLEAVLVTATRTGRRVEDEPTRVEVLPREEVEEKLLMTPGDVAMMMNETGGLRVQTTSPSLGGATVRIQGLRGRYTQLLADGLPLYGGQTGSLGLLQIPPMDLAQVEVIKGAASALYGPAALGGVVNLVSRRPADAGEAELLLNQTTRGGTDGVLWLSGPLRDAWGYTLLAGGHRQLRRDVDADGWADLPGFERLVLRPRLFHQAASGSSVFLTGGATLEQRAGGTLPGRVAPDGAPFPEELTTRRVDLGVVTRLPFHSGTVLNARASLMQQTHGHVFGPRGEDDRHRTAFAEVTFGGQTGRGAWLLGTAVQYDGYRSDDVPGFDYGYTVPSLFAQADLDLAPRVALLASGRLDAHSEYGLFANPR